MFAPSGTPYLSPPSMKKRQISANGCTPCAGNRNECCGAPGDYALVYHNTPNVVGSVIEASYTSYSAIPASSVIAYTSSSFTETSSTSSSSISASSVVVDTSSSTITSTTSSIAEPTNYFTPSTLTYDSATKSTSSVTLAISTSISGSSISSSVSTISTSSSVTEPTSYFPPSTLTYNSTTRSTESVTFVAPTTFAPIGSIPASGNGSSGSINSSTYSSSLGTGSGTGSLFSPSPSIFAPYPNQTLSNTSVFSTGAIPSSSSAPYFNETLSSISDHSPTATPSLSSSSTPRVSIAPGVQGSNSGATTTTNGATTTTSSGGPEPTVESPTPSCVQAAGYTGNNTMYNDYFGFTYDIRCNLDLQSTPTDHDAYAGSFEDCLEYCSLLTYCVAVTYEDPASPPQNSSNCYPKWDFGGYNASSTDGVYSGVNVNGPSPGTLENQNLCTTDNYQDSSYDGQTYYDDFGLAWAIGCNNTVAIASSEALYPTVTDTLASCIDYCSVYDSCEAVNWLGSHTNGTTNDPNCFPASSNGTAGATGSAPGFGYAVLVVF